MRNWSMSENIREPLRIICGGPGYGKSSFAKVFCEEINNEYEESDSQQRQHALKALYIPLQRIELASGKDATEQINAYLRQERFDFCDPFSLSPDESLLLVLDGLDELAMQGSEAKRAAIKFVNEVANSMQSVNTTRFRLRCLVCGRDIMVQDVANMLQLEELVWHLVPYIWREEDHSRSYRSPHDPNGAAMRADYYYGDTREILAEDQRPIWWKKYGIATGRHYPDMPPPLRSVNLVSLTSLPLLNYLVALSYERAPGRFGDKITRNSIYYDLLKRIHERDWASSGSTPRNIHTRGMRFDTFVRVLEEVALAAWRSGDTRTAQVKDIETACTRVGLLEAWQSFEAKEEGLTRILTAFYVRWHKFGPGVVEFMHKSFGDYLAARAIINLWEGVARSHFKSGRAAENLLDWLDKCGQSGIDTYILSFIRDEVTLRDEHKETWQKTSAQLIQHSISFGIQTEVIDSNLLDVVFINTTFPDDLIARTKDD
ncbi:MAG: hypothetical protein EOP06_11800, partial [Proteobacteria bacterium]